MAKKSSSEDKTDTGSSKEDVASKQQNSSSSAKKTPSTAAKAKTRTRRGTSATVKKTTATKANVNASTTDKQVTAEKIKNAPEAIAAGASKQVKQAAKTTPASADKTKTAAGKKPQSPGARPSASTSKKAAPAEKTSGVKIEPSGTGLPASAQAPVKSTAQTVDSQQTPELKRSAVDAIAAEHKTDTVPGQASSGHFVAPGTTPGQLEARQPSVEEAAKAIVPPIPEVSIPEEKPNEQEQHAENIQHYEQPGPQYDSMYVVQITPELAPLAKVGGLADVVTGLSRELEIRGNTVEIILPKYDSMRYDAIWGLCITYDDLWVPWFDGHVHCTVWFGFVQHRKCFFIEPHSPDNFFNRGSVYGFDDDIMRFAFFSRAAIEFLFKAGKHPDIIHCHDWQTALVPVFLYEIYQHMGMTHPRVCYTIHNFKHQGKTGEFLLEATGLHRPEYYFHYDRLLDNQIPHAVNLMKGGVVYSNFVTTVSPKYAGETKDGGQGFGLEPTLHSHHYKYGGIVNGIDYDVWNPEIDIHIPSHYNVNNIDAKYVNKRALRNRLLLADSDKPIIAFIGRLDPQKGLELVRHALFYSLNNAAQFVLLGSSPDAEINNYFWELKRHLNDSPDCHIEVGFDEDLAHLIYAGADMIIVPSLFEPCGLTQLIAMQYGTIPIVRAVGGLSDTVYDKDNAHDKPLHERNGYVFNDYDNAGIESALSRAIACYYQYPEHFRDLMKNAMNYDYSWKNAGQHYLNIYDYIREK